MTSNSPATELSPEHGEMLLGVASRSIAHGLGEREPMNVLAEDFPVELQAVRATFVTLRIAGDLRGCMGTLSARSPMVADVAGNAFAAAFRDPRFSGLSAEEFSGTRISLSILNDAEPIEFGSESELLGKVRPGVDGLILRHRSRRGLLLPSVWEVLPDPHEFLAHLKQKADLSRDFWADDITVERFTATSIIESRDESPESRDCDGDIADCS